MLLAVPNVLSEKHSVLSNTEGSPVAYRLSINVAGDLKTASDRRNGSPLPARVGLAIGFGAGLTVQLMVSHFASKPIGDYWDRLASENHW
jgi:hypothetical protein